MLASDDDTRTDAAPLRRSAFADVTASDYPAGPDESPEPVRPGRTIQPADPIDRDAWRWDPRLAREGDLIARLRFLVEHDRETAVLVLAELPQSVLDAAYMAAHPDPPRRQPVPR